LGNWLQFQLVGGVPLLSSEQKEKLNPWQQGELLVCRVTGQVLLDRFRLSSKRVLPGPGDIFLRPVEETGPLIEALWLPYEVLIRLRQVHFQRIGRQSAHRTSPCVRSLSLRFGHERTA
jgi:hypothetical protein